ncbi:hypothetical protein HMPREF1624_06727 [Sporothrix schenckii ATCC 58251]|uniref:Chromo domain-containing protein n=1 Tax=Sporothrix schenckii (strain ATCC 58251 / de Perez 2211183) TaxID=1391915 RepID=U7PLK5_SPOS1|nr:hypothetical protein HMPREF1624_06727 [Sporothrix schenckii ATCC 58251]
MSDGSGVGAVTTPPPSKRGRKTGAYADAAEEDEDSINSSGNNKPNKRDGGRAKGVSQSNGSALPASRKKDVDSKDQNEKGTSGDDDDVDEDEDDEDGDEYEVQQIIDHMLDENEEPRFRVVWKGYESPSDHTWEPEDNLAENASEILSEYITKIGGRPKLFEKPSKGKKRGRQPASASPTTASKRPKKSEDHPADRESPAEVQKVFKPPAGSWEDEVVDVEMFRGDDGELRVFLTWRNGSKSQHAAQHAYILRFYESRISFKTPTE